MAHYRAYFIGHDGRFSKAEEFHSDSDTDALKNARKIAGGHPVELWQEARRVALIETEKKQA